MVTTLVLLSVDMVVQGLCCVAGFCRFLFSVAVSRTARAKVYIISKQNHLPEELHSTTPPDTATLSE
ncbi:MAG: hypothetical protein ACLR8Y_22310 [Alistipes indistinctus]